MLEERVMYSGVCNLPRFYMVKVLFTHIFQQLYEPDNGPGECTYGLDDGSQRNVTCDNTFPVKSKI